jgi:hypothetical protein
MFAECEDDLGKELLVRILDHVGVEPENWVINVAGGNGPMRAKIKQWTEVGRREHVVLLTDLDATRCASGLVASWLGRHPKPIGLHIRVAVRTAESWVLADRAAFAKFLAVSPALVPMQPDLEPSPKQRLLQLAEKSPRRRLRADIVARRHGQPRQAPNYNAALRPFVAKRWDVSRAAKASPSLARALRRLAASLGTRL